MDIIFVFMTVEEFHNTTISSKTRGTWNLHNAVNEHNLLLDFLITLSSISRVVDHKSHAKTAAANVFLDSFSSYREGLWLQAYSADLGGIEAVGCTRERETTSKRLNASI